MHISNIFLLSLMECLDFVQSVLCISQAGILPKILPQKIRTVLGERSLSIRILCFGKMGFCTRWWVGQSRGWSSWQSGEKTWEWTLGNLKSQTAQKSGLTTRSGLGTRYSWVEKSGGAGWKYSLGNEGEFSGLSTFPISQCHVCSGAFEEKLEVFSLPCK